MILKRLIWQKIKSIENDKKEIIKIQSYGKEN